MLKGNFCSVSEMNKLTFSHTEKILNFTPANTKVIKGPACVVAHACNLSTLEGEAGTPEV